jgi:hypothetical protein
MPHRSGGGRKGDYTIPAAALKLGMSQKTVRRRIRAGQLQARRVGGRGGGRWLITPQALAGDRRRRARAAKQRTTIRWMARMSFGASLPPDVTPAPVADSTRYCYGPPDAPVHRATLCVNFDEWWRFAARRPASSVDEATAIFAELRGRCGLPPGAAVCLRVCFELDPEDLQRVLRQVVRSVRTPRGLLDLPQDLQTEAVTHLRLNGLPALSRVREDDPRRYLRRMVRNFYRSRGRAHARRARDLDTINALADVLPGPSGESDAALTD